MDAVKQWFNGLAARERRFVAIGGIAALVIVLLMAVLPLQRSAAALEQRVATKRDDLAWMRSVAPALASAGPVSETPITQESLVVTVDRTARESSLGEALARSEPAAQGGQRVQLNAARFDMMVAWLARLRQQHGIRVVAATIERTEQPGLVNATVELNAL